ncbi:MAG TPA: dihydrodipicolinate synthase family protein [Longimicrobium sp.]|jgi:4-hydroxy-tetrahydrodipicolinate synthase
MDISMVQGLSGIYSIIITPFDERGRVDEGSLRRLLDSTIETGVDGVTVLGVAGEAPKLSTDERALIVSVALDVARGRVPVVVGTSSMQLDVTVAASVAAEAAGAASVMIAPPRGIQGGSPLVDCFRRVADAIGISIVLQDYPEASGVHLTPAEMAELLRAVPQICTIKLESVPTPWRIHQTRELLDEGRTILGGMGGVYFLDELRRGASGTMTGFAYPEILLEILRSWNAHDRAGAAAVYAKYLPLLVFEGQPKIGLAIRKEILRQRGLIDFASLRQPAMEMDVVLLDDLADVLTLTDVRDLYD